MKANLSTKSIARTAPLINLNLRFFVYPGFLLLLFFPPFFRGLFFPPELLTTHMFTAVLFALCWYDKLIHRDSRFLVSRFDYLMVFYLLAYISSLFGALNMRGAVGEVLKVTNYFMVYWITTQVIKQEKDIKILLKTIYFSTLGVALIGLGTAVNLFKYPGAYVGNRIYSTLQYPNTLAVFLTVGIIIGLVLMVNSDKNLPKFLYTLGNLPLMTVILGSNSRGNWLMFPLVMILLVTGVSKKQRYEIFISLVITLGVSLQIYRSMLPGIESGTGLGSLKFILLGAVIALGGQGLYLWINGFLEKKMVAKGVKNLLAAGVIIYALGVLSIYVLYSTQVLPSVTSQFVPVTVIKRAQTIQNTDNSFIGRFQYSKTALKIALNFPLNGTGGEGWNSVYHSYMPFLDWTTEVHNNFGKVLVETGFIGFGIFLALWIKLLKNLFVFRRAKLAANSWTMIWAAGVAALTLGIHSAFDFDLSMAAMSIILFVLFGIVEGAKRFYLRRRSVENDVSRNLGIAFLVGTLGAFLLFFPAYRLYAAGITGAEGAQAMLAKNWVQAENKLLRAQELDPFSASYPGDLAQIYTVWALTEKNVQKFKLADIYAEKAIKREPYNFQLRSRLVLVFLSQQKIERAVQEAEQVLEINPLYMPSYEALGRVYVGAGQYYGNRGQVKKANAYWRKVLEIPSLIQNKKTAFSLTPPYWKGVPLEITPVITMLTGQAQYFMGDLNAARRTLNIIQDNPEVKAEAKLYLEAMK